MGNANIDHLRSVLGPHKPVCSLANGGAPFIGVSVSEPNFGSSGADLPPRLVEVGYFPAWKIAALELENVGFSDSVFPRLEIHVTLVQPALHTHSTAGAHTWLRDRYPHPWRTHPRWLECERVCVRRARSQNEQCWHFPRKSSRGVPCRTGIFDSGFPFPVP